MAGWRRNEKTNRTGARVAFGWKRARARGREKAADGQLALGWFLSLSLSFALSLSLPLLPLPFSILRLSASPVSLGIQPTSFHQPTNHSSSIRPLVHPTIHHPLSTSSVYPSVYLPICPSAHSVPPSLTCSGFPAHSHRPVRSSTADDADLMLSTVGVLVS